MSKRALVVLSGGQDSATCLFWAQKYFDEVGAISFEYGQRHRVELEFAKKIAKEAKIDHEIVNLGFFSTLNKTALSHSEIEPTNAGGYAGLPSTFVPGRNAIFLSVAAAYALPRGYFHLVTGVCETDYSGYPDCRMEFIESLEQSLSLAMDTGLKIHTPLMYLNKAQTFALAAELGVLDIVKNETLSCYRGELEKMNIWGRGCDHCPACELRKRGYQEFAQKQSQAQLPTTEDESKFREEARLWR